MTLHAVRKRSGPPTPAARAEASPNTARPRPAQKSPEEKKRLVYAARDHAAEALRLDDSNFACHKWAGITLSDVGDFEGTKVVARRTARTLGPTC